MKTIAAQTSMASCGVVIPTRVDTAHDHYYVSATAQLHILMTILYSSLVLNPFGIFVEIKSD